MRNMVSKVLNKTEQVLKLYSIPTGEILKYTLVNEMSINSERTLQQMHYFLEVMFVKNWGI